MSKICINENCPVELEPIEHVYFHKETGKAYTSVTQVISSIENEFDSENVAEAISHQPEDKKNSAYSGMSSDQILDYWQKLNDDANEYGTKIHETIENYLLNNKWYFPKDELEEKVIPAYDNLDIDEGMFLYPERVLFSQDYELAGTADFLADIDDEFFDIGDYKSNRRFNYYSPFGDTLKKPFEHLQDCHYSIYSLQLSTYALMYELETGKKCRRIWIGYWDRNTEEIYYIPIMYMRTEAYKLLEHHKFMNQLRGDI